MDSLFSIYLFFFFIRACEADSSQVSYIRKHSKHSTLTSYILDAQLLSWYYKQSLTSVNDMNLNNILMKMERLSHYLMIVRFKAVNLIYHICILLKICNSEETKTKKV